MPVTLLSKFRLDLLVLAVLDDFWRERALSLREQLVDRRADNHHLAIAIGVLSPA